MDYRNHYMNLHQRMTMMGQSHIGPVPGSIPINFPMGTPAPEGTGMEGGVPMSSNQATFANKADPNKMIGVRSETSSSVNDIEERAEWVPANKIPEQQHNTKLPLRKEVDDEGRICSVGLPETDTPLPTEGHNEIKEESSQQKVKTEDDEFEDFNEFIENARDIFLKVSSKELTIKAASEQLGRPYSFTYCRYQEFCDKITGDDKSPIPKRKRSAKAKKPRKKKRLTLVKSRPKLSGVIYQCSECTASFYRETQLKHHSKVHLKENEAHKCTACGVVFCKLTKLMRHRIEFHQEALQCPHCESQFTIIASYKYHIRTHGGEKPYVCGECGKGFYQKYSLQNHKRIHTGERPYMCGYCEKTFISLNELKRHQTVHTGGQEKPFACEQCGKRYLANSALMEHMNIHTGAKPYACELCDARFNFKQNLRRHNMVHTGEQPYKCDVCPAAFTLSTDLKRHTTLHTGLKPFKCDLCDYACTRKSNLEFHKYTHTGETPFKCDFYGCNAEFSRPKSLKKHKLKHGPPPPQTCKVCHDKFPDLIALKHHMRIHTGEKPHTCDQCFKTCADKSALKRHMYKHMYPRPHENKTKQVRQRTKNPGVKKPISTPIAAAVSAAAVNVMPHKKWPPSEYQVPETAENGHSSQGLPSAAAVGHYAWNINANINEDTNSQPSFHPFTASQYTNLVNSGWPSTMDADELRRRLLNSFK